MPPSKGRGVVSSVKRAFNKAKTAVKNFKAGARLRAPPKVREFIETHKNDKIVGLKVGRVPLDKPLQQFLNFLSGGKYEAARQKLGYNDIYHTFLIAEFEDGRQFRIEKNSSVEINPAKTQKKAEYETVQLYQPIPLGDFIERGQKQYNITKPKVERADNFWQYDATNNNCQYFVDDLVKGSQGAYIPPNEVNEVEKFAKQDIAPITEHLPGFTKSVLDLRQRLDHAIDGDGLHDLKLHMLKHLTKPKSVQEGQGVFGDIWKRVSGWLWGKLKQTKQLGPIVEVGSKIKPLGPKLNHGPPRDAKVPVLKRKKMARNFKDQIDQLDDSEQAGAGLRDSKRRKVYAW